MGDRKAAEDVQSIESKLSDIQKSISNLLAEERTMKEMLRQRRGPSTADDLDPSPAMEEIDSEEEEEEEKCEEPTLKMVSDHGEAYTSLVLIAPYGYTKCNNGALFVLKLKKREEEEEEDMCEEGRGGVIPRLEPAYKMFDGFDNIPRECWVVYARLFTGKSSNLYLAASGFSPYEPDTNIFSGFVFNMYNKSSFLPVPIKPPAATKPPGKLMSAYGNLYFLTDPQNYPEIEEPSFERYCPATHKWEKMPSFPYYYYSGKSVLIIVGFAVFQGVILISAINAENEFRLFAFNVSREKWSRVKVDTYNGVPFIGRAVVVGRTLYALSEFDEDQIMAFSFKMDAGDNGDLVYSVRKLFSLGGLNIASPPVPFSTGFNKSEFLVHLGNLDFFYIKSRPSIFGYDERDQFISITEFQIVGEEGKKAIKTLHSTVFAAPTGTCTLFESGFIPEHEEFEPEEDKERVKALLEEAERRNKAKRDKAKQRKGKLREKLGIGGADRQVQTESMVGVKIM